MADNRKLAQGLRNLPASAREDLAGREQDIQRGKTVELLRRAGKEMYENPIVNTAVGLSPVLGDIQAGVEAYRSAQEGDWGNAGLNAMGILPFIPMLGKTVWHGSPHTFDKFDLSKIGTGEGAQSYGHGLYLAENPKVAEDYRRNLSVTKQLSENQFNPDGTPNRVYQAAYQIDAGVPNDEVRFGLETLGHSAEEAQQIVRDAQKLFRETNENAGALYKVDLPDEQIAKMLDWDKPLTEQTKEVKEFAANMARSTNTWNNYFSQLNPKAQKLANEMLAGEKPIVGSESAKYWKQLDKLNPNVDHNAIFDSLYDSGLRSGQRDVTGSDLYNVLTRKSTQQGASNDLFNAGIPGIQYLDQASRGAGDGTRNYVVFSDEIPQILERNNQPVGMFK
jgi:hypothetical protein